MRPRLLCCNVWSQKQARPLVRRSTPRHQGSQRKCLHRGEQGSDEARGERQRCLSPHPLALLRLKRAQRNNATQAKKGSEGIEKSPPRRRVAALNRPNAPPGRCGRGALCLFAHSLERRPASRAIGGAGHLHCTRAFSLSVPVYWKHARSVVRDLHLGKNVDKTKINSVRPIYISGGNFFLTHFPQT